MENCAQVLKSERETERAPSLGKSSHRASTGEKAREPLLLREAYPNESSSLLMVLFKSLSTCRKVSILLMECSTVV